MVKVSTLSNRFDHYSGENMRLCRQARAAKILGDRQRLNPFRREGLTQLRRLGFFGSPSGLFAIHVHPFSPILRLQGTVATSGKHRRIEGATPMCRSATTRRWRGSHWLSLVALTNRGNTASVAVSKHVR